MDEFFNEMDQSGTDGNEPEIKSGETAFEGFEPVQQPQEDYTQSTEPFYGTAEADSPYNPTQPFTTVYNPVNFSPVEPIENYKPMSRGLKVFAFLLALVIVATGACFAGYYIGKSDLFAKKSTTKASVNLAAAPVDTDELTPAQVYAQVKESIVGIRIYSNTSQGGQASGIILSEDGYIITNDHIYSEIPAAKFRIYIYDKDDNCKEYDAEYVAGDKVSDLAVLKIDSKDKFVPAEFGNSDELFYGQNVVAIGRPNDSTDPSSITRGVISALNRRVQTTSNYSARLIQTDSAINPGSSGGALVNMYGQVIGVTSSKLASVEYDAVGYAIPTTTVKRIVDELIDKGEVKSRAKLGVTYMAIDSVTKEIGGYATTGLLLDAVAEDSDLYGKAEKGDFITHINGIEATSDDVVLDIIEQSSAGDTISVTIYRTDGKTVTVDAVLKANISESSYTLVENDDDHSDGNGSGGGIFDFPEGD